MAPTATDGETCEALTQADAEYLSEQGYVVVRRVLSAENCDALREHVLLTTDEAARQGRNDLFGNIQEADKRYDLKLDLCGPVVEALNSFVARCGVVLQQAVQGNARVVELAAISSDGGAVAQPVHADTMHGVTRFLQSDIQLPEFEEHCEEDEDDDIGKIVQAVATETAMIYTALVALQDIESDMGPTHVWPATNTVEHHATLWGTHVAGKLSVEDADKAFGVAHKKMTLKRGDLVLYDSRTMHCGGANCSDKRRSVLCISVMGPGIRPDGTTWTMLKSLRNKLSIASFPRSPGTSPHNTAECTEVVLPPPPQQADEKSNTDSKGTAGGKSDGEWKPVPPLDEWEAAVQCSFCSKWRPCSGTEAPKLMGLENGFQCPLVGFSCMQDQVYSTPQIDEALS